MNQFVFKSRWIALAFAVLTIFSAYVFVGGWGAVNEADSTESPASDAQVAQGTGEPAQADTGQSMDEAEFVEDDELVDDAGGEDPTPPDGDSAGDNGDGGDPDGSDFAENAVPDGAVVARPGPAQYAPDGTPIVMAN